jgi:type IV pilus assembly protein PilC
MISFHYTALDGNGREVTGDILAGSRDEATEQVRRLGVFPTNLVGRNPALPAAAQRSAAAAAGQRLFAPRLAARRLALFTRQLATLLYAGMPLVRAMHLLEQQAADSAERRVIGDVVGAVESGSTFSDALGRQPRTFNRLYISMVRAGEASGQMEAVLRRQAELMEKQRRLVRQVRGALAYPTIVCLVATLITAGLMIFIVPKFAAMFAEMLGGCPLPFLTRMVIAVSNTLLHRAYVFAAVAVAAVALWKAVRASRIGAYWTDRVALGVPGLGAMLRLSACAHFCSTLGTLTRSGVPLLSALQIVRDGTRNRVLTLAVECVREAVKEGEPISGTMKRTGAFPAMLVGMVQVGEETGSLPEMLERVAQSYAEEVDAAVESLTSMIEPLLIVFLAGIVGTIVIGLFLPLLKIALMMSGSN